MIDYTNIRRLVEERIASISLIPPVVFENTDILQDAEHVEVTDEDIESSPVCLGSSARFVTGKLIISIYTKQGVGTDRAREIASTICNNLASWDNPTIFLKREEEFFSVGKVEDSSMYQHNLIIPYNYQYGES
jgi:hypothetical protein